MKQNETPALGLARLCLSALDEKKAENIRILDVGSVSTITDFLVIATATSDPHLRALRVELEKVVDAVPTRIVGTETAVESGWIVVDLFDVMVHLFTAERREHYGLERLWKDAPDVTNPDARPQPAKAVAPPKKKAKAAKPAAKAKTVRRAPPTTGTRPAKGVKKGGKAPKTAGKPKKAR